MNFVEVPIIRGFTEIKPLWDLVQKHKGYICGGYVRYMASQSKRIAPCEDVDVFAPNMEIFNILSKELQSLFPCQWKTKISENYEPYKSEHIAWRGCPKIQLITPKSQGKIHTQGNIEEVLGNFDYTVVRIAIKDENTCIADENFVDDENRKYLRVMNIHCPINSVFRLAKYMKKGYRTKPIEIIKLFRDWEDRGVDYRAELVELLTRAAEYDTEVEGSGLSKEETDMLYELMNVD